MNNAVAHLESGVQTWYQGCWRTSRKASTWKARQVRICVSTEKSRGAEIRLAGGRWDTRSLHAGFRLTGRGDHNHNHNHNQNRSSESQIRIRNSFITESNKIEILKPNANPKRQKNIYI